MRVTVIVLLSVCAISFLPMESFGSHYSHYGISLSKSCIAMIANSYDTSCPTYEEILAIYPDTSNKIMSGDFEYENGLYQRGHGMAKNNHFEFYKYHEGTTIWIDPPGDIRGKVKMITIEPSLPEYKLTGVSYNMINGTIQTGYNRHISHDCSDIIISATDWMFLVGDTMKVLKHDCNMEYSNFDHIKEKSFTLSDIDITTSYKYQLDKWFVESRERCLVICKEY